MPDFGSASLTQDDSTNAPSGGAPPNTLDNNIREIKGAAVREWNWRSYTLTAGGTANAKTLTYSVAPDAYYNGQRFAFIANTTNTGSATLNVNVKGAKTIRKDVSGTLTDLANGDMVAGMYVEVTYNAANDCFVWVNQKALPPTASDTVAGIVELATNAEALTGTDATRAMTPDAVAALWDQGTDIASAATITIGDGGYFVVTGTTTITAITVTTGRTGRPFRLRFAGVLTLTHNATTLILPGGANITTAAGDHAVFVVRSGGVECVDYQRADGRALAGNTSITLGTPANSTSGTSIDFTGIPANVNRVTLKLSGVSINSTDRVVIRVGSGSFQTSGYQSSAISRVNETGSFNHFEVDAWQFGDPAAGFLRSGLCTLERLTGSTWVFSSVLMFSAGTSRISVGAGSVTLSGALDRVRVTTSSGSDTFDAGTINISWEA